MYFVYSNEVSFLNIIFEHVNAPLPPLPPPHLDTVYYNEEVEMAVLERLQMQEPYLCRDGVFKCVPGWDECVIVFEDLGYKAVRFQQKNEVRFNVLLIYLL
jgi:hypothetical protein